MCPSGRRDKRLALAEKATYPKGSEAGDAVDSMLEFYGVDKGVIRDPAYCEPWDDGAAEMDRFNSSWAEPEGGMQMFRTTHDRRCLQEVKPAAGHKCFIADLNSARQCGYTRDQRVYWVDNPSHSVVTDVSRMLSSLARHQAPVLMVPMIVLGWIRMDSVEQFCSCPAWFMIEAMRANVKARFQLLSSCDAKDDPNVASTLCHVEGYRVTQGYSIEWLRP